MSALSSPNWVEPQRAPSPSIPMGWTDSEFQDDVWRARTRNPANDGPYTFDFATIQAPHRETTKWLLWGLEHHDDLGMGRRMRSAGSFIRVFKAARHFFRYAETRLGPHARLETIPDDIVHDAVVAFAALDTDAPRVMPYVEAYVRTLDALWSLGPAGVGILPDGLSFKASDAVAGTLRHGIGGQTLAEVSSTVELPEDVARALLNRAIDALGETKDALLAIREIAASMYEEAPHTRPGAQNAARDRQRYFRKRPEVAGRLHMAISRLPFAAHALAQERTDYDRLAGTDDVRRSLFPQRQIDLLQDSLETHVTAACYIVIAGFTGFRVSEILSLERGWLEKLGGRLMLSTRILKTSIPVDGTVVARLVPEIVRDAYAVLEACAQPWMTEDDGRLFLRGRGTVRPQKVVSEHLTRFADLHGIPRGDGIETHQFRKFFALFYIRRFQGSPDAVRRHFRHVSRHMVWMYVSEAGAASYLAREKRRLAAEICADIVFGEGNGQASDIGRGSPRYRASNLPLEQIERRLALGGISEIHPMPWGYCLIQRDDLGAACDAKDGPNVVEMSPDVCGGCRFLGTGKENVEVWKGIHLLHQEVVRSPYVTPIAKRASERMLAVSRRVMGIDAPGRTR